MNEQFCFNTRNHVTGHIKFTNLECPQYGLIFKQGVKKFRPFFKLILDVSDVISLSLQEKMADCSTHGKSILFRDVR
jgi:hypothetical protein